ncbi:flagellar biosynthesis protein FlhG [Polaromonas sp. OV174]|uniref:hypothetical protein n=1 Tax=Polaromonas sp. OV174 TaxID=1855300 RepID=UPI0008E02214|nr:hypothetical protein [Polaromonas sp. OV174]SFC06012.1 flagellar biosynthesis protein FlhG [Polaromonas sp. OV174]
MSKVVTDQADGLRRLMASSLGRLVVVLGHEPAAGAASVAQNLAAALVQQGQDVLLLNEHDGPQPGALQRDGRLVLVDARLDQDGALSPFAAQADNVMVVLQPHAASITQAYACIKRLHYAHALQRVRVLVNQVADEAEAKRILENLARTGSRYLAVALEPAGWVRADPLLLQAQRLDLTVVEAFQSSPAARDFRRIAADLLQWPYLPAGRRTPATSAGAKASGDARAVCEMH